MGQQPQKVDIQNVFKEKNPGLAKLLPGFVFRYLKRIIHEEEINHFLSLYGDRYGADFAHAAIKHFNVNVSVEGEENIPKDRRLIFASNHPLGGFDGIILMHLLDNMGFTIRLLVNDILQNIGNFDPLFLPINKHGGNSRDAVDKINEAFHSDMQIVSFPSGMVSRRIKGKITDLDWQKNFIVKAKFHRRDVVPVHISGRNTNFFYNLHSLRKRLGIKANIEMFYLVDETYRHQNKSFTVTFGKPVSYTIFDNKYSPAEWAGKVKKHLYQLPDQSDLDFTP